MPGPRTPHIDALHSMTIDCGNAETQRPLARTRYLGSAPPDTGMPRMRR